jgi:multidrug transporter EmrE-like cation transporter
MNGASQAKLHSSTFAGNIIKSFMSQQNYQNHKQVVYGYYLWTGVPIIILIFISIKWITMDDIVMKLWGLMFLLVGWIFLTMLFRSRGFALKAQDRAIRSEENLRHFVLTGKLHDERLSIKQIIALRFASDEEVQALSQRAVSENLSPDAIKKEIKNWRADTYRV